MTDGILLKDIPQRVLDEVMMSLKNYLVAVYVMLQEKPQPRLRAIGSGTLVEIEGGHYVLTAAHVWYETREADQIGLVLTDHQTSFAIPRDSISVKQLWNGEMAEWGPDIALLKLPKPSISTIEAHKSFLNLRRQKDDLASFPPATENGLWAITGMVGESTEIRRYPEKGIIEGHLQGNAFFSSIHKVCERTDYDYFDLEADLGLVDVPSTFGGVSGGGLWDVRLVMSKSKEVVWDQKRHFRGLAFWQTESSDSRRMIRCHGPKSIYDKAWQLISNSHE